VLAKLILTTKKLFSHICRLSVAGSDYRTVKQNNTIVQDNVLGKNNYPVIR